MSTYRLGLVAIVTIMASGCALASQDKARLIEPEHVPYDLVGVEPRDAPMFDSRLELRPITIYLVETLPNGERRLTARQRYLPDPVNLSTVVANLMAGGVSPEERSDRLINQVPGDELRSIERTELTSDMESARPNPHGPVAVIEVDAEFFNRFPSHEAQRLAIGQIVLTITGHTARSGAPPVEQVRFTVGHHERFAPTGNPGQPMLGVVRAADYASRRAPDTG